MRRKGVWQIGALALVGLLLASCGTNPGASPEGPVTLAGVVASDGTLAGRSLDLSAAQVTKNGEPAQAELRPGMVVEVRGEARGSSVRVASADIKIELKGEIEAIDLTAGTLTVLGTRVQVDALTRIEEEDGPSLALADLRVGDFVEVSGVRQADGSVLATYIERYPAGGSGQSEIEVKGFACNLDAVAKTFDLWSSPDCADPEAATGLAVDYSGATKVEGNPAEGAPVEVEGRLDGNTIHAREVEFEHGTSSDHGEIELYGPIGELDTEAMTFTLLDYRVDYSRARVEGTLTEGAYVEVEGSLDANDPTLVHAREVEVKYPHGGSDDHVPSHEVKGRIEAIDPDAMTLTVAGMDFYADEFTVIKEDDPDRPIAFTDLAAGDWVEVKYDATAQNGDGAYYAVKIEREGYDEDGDHGGSYHELEGYVQNLDAENRTFEVGGVVVTVDDATRYEDDRTDRYLSADEFWSSVREGDRVEVEGSYRDGTLLAHEIELKDPHDD